jgi:hypothetical protein
MRKAAPAPLDRTELRVLVEAYYDVQQMRLECENRIRAAVERQGLDADKAKALQDWMDERLARQEAELRSMVRQRIRGQPLWELWLKDVKGVGPCIAGGLFAWAGDLSRFDTVSKLWAYAGLHTVDGLAPRRQRGQKANWNPRLRVLAWKAAESFVRCGDGYRRLYLEEKERLRRLHPEPVPWDPPRLKRDGTPLLRFSDGHVDAMARRKVAKVFLAHCWQRGRELAGLPTRLPYVIEVLGHTGVIPVIER